MNYNNINIYKSAGDDDNISEVKEYVESGGDINKTDEGGCTPLHKASFNGEDEVVELLLANGADVTIKTNNGYTARDIAIKRGYDNIVQLFDNSMEIKREAEHYRKILSDKNTTDDEVKMNNNNNKKRKYNQITQRKNNNNESNNTNKINNIEQKLSSHIANQNEVKNMHNKINNINNEMKNMHNEFNDMKRDIEDMKKLLFLLQNQ